MSEDCFVFPIGRLQAYSKFKSQCHQTFDNELNLAGSESLEGLKFDNIKPQQIVPSFLWYTVQAVV